MNKGDLYKMNYIVMTEFTPAYFLWSFRGEAKNPNVLILS